MNIRRNKSIIKFVLPVVAVVGVAGWLVANSHAEQPAAPAAAAVSRPALTVRTTTLREDKWARSLAANGSILPWQEAVISAQVQGLRIAEVKVSIGDHVQQGDVLFTVANSARASGIKRFTFTDDLFVQDRRWILKLLGRMKEEGTDRK